MNKISIIAQPKRLLGIKNIPFLLNQCGFILKYQRRIHNYFKVFSKIGIWVQEFYHARIYLI